MNRPVNGLSSTNGLVVSAFYTVRSLVMNGTLSKSILNLKGRGDGDYISYCAVTTRMILC